MQIVIKKNASAIYCGSFPPRGIPNREWADILRKIEGMTIEIDTKHLFRDQFNTVPLPGISDIALGVPDSVVERVIDDVRPGMVKCRDCGTTWKMPMGSFDDCPECGNPRFQRLG